MNEEEMNEVRNRNLFDIHELHRERNEMVNPQEGEEGFIGEDIEQVYDELCNFYFNDDEEELLLCKPNVVCGFMMEKQLDKEDIEKVFELMLYKLEVKIEEENALGMNKDEEYMNGLLEQKYEIEVYMIEKL